MKYVVFEAGSRAGFSAEMFFLDYLKRTGKAMIIDVDQFRDQWEEK